MIATKSILKSQPATEKIRISRLFNKSIVYIALLLLLAGYLVSVCVFAETLQVSSLEFFRHLVSFLSNPFIGLFVGLLMVSILQRTSLTILLVTILASTGLLTSVQLVPVIVGINIGITLTHHIISFGRTSKRKDFRRVIAIATVHSFFSICVALVIFPLEYFFRLPSQVLTFLIERINLPANQYRGFKNLVNPVIKFLAETFQQYPVVLLILAAISFIVCFRLFSENMKKLFEKRLQKQNTLLSFDKSVRRLVAEGILTATAIQSGVLTVSLIIPLIISRKISLRRAFPFVAGAYLGATVVPLVLTLFLLNNGALQVALGHFLFVAFGLLIFLPFPSLRYIPVILSRKLATLTLRNRTIGLLYILVVFFLIPFLLILATK